MTITYPITDILTAVAFQDQTFQPQFRQELSRTAIGRTIGKDLGPALWVATYKTIGLDADDALAYEAKLNSLDGVIHDFEAFDLRRRFPRAHPDGAFNDDGVLASVNASNRALTLSGLDAGQTISAGDYLAFDYGGSRALHQALETAVANGSGETPEFEVRPHVRPGYVLNNAVTLKTPRGRFSLAPGSVTTALQDGLFTVVSFQAVQIV